jgi:hypothetical protein
MSNTELIISAACREVIAAIRAGRRIGHAASMWACALTLQTAVEDATDALWAGDEAAS